MTDPKDSEFYIKGTMDIEEDPIVLPDPETLKIIRYVEIAVERKIREKLVANFDFIRLISHNLNEIQTDLINMRNDFDSYKKELNNKLRLALKKEYIEHVVNNIVKAIEKDVKKYPDLKKDIYDKIKDIIDSSVE